MNENRCGNDFLSLSLAKNRNEIFRSILGGGADLIDVVTALPITGVLRKAYSTHITIHSYLFWRKMVMFLNESSQIGGSKFERFWEKAQTELPQMADCLVNMLDTCDSEAKARVMGLIYKMQSLTN